MAEVLNILVALAVIVFVVRWMASRAPSAGTSGERAADKTADILGFRPKEVTPEMISSIQAMFPDLPLDNIRYDLLRTGSVELTTHKILEKGYLAAPPSSYYRVWPRTESPAPPPSNTTTRPTLDGPPQQAKPKETLIQRFKLEDRVDTFMMEDSESPDSGGKTTWTDSREERERSLQERKAQMILAARQRMLAQAKGKGKEKAL